MHLGGAFGHRRPAPLAVEEHPLPEVTAGCSGLFGGMRRTSSA
jgi:hypothetical protein